jgi:hypothetical protein
MELRKRPRPCDAGGERYIIAASFRHETAFQVVMPIARHVAAFLVGIILSLGGLGGQGAHMAMAGQPVMATMLSPFVSHAQTQHQHAGDKAGHTGAHAGQSSATSSAPVCCPFACGLLTVLPSPDLGFSNVGWEIMRRQAPADDMMAGRSISPLRRPPRQSA